MTTLPPGIKVARWLTPQDVAKVTAMSELLPVPPPEPTMNYPLLGNGESLIREMILTRSWNIACRVHGLTPGYDACRSVTVGEPAAYIEEGTGDTLGHLLCIGCVESLAEEGHSELLELVCRKCLEERVS